ncbi:dnaJ homolog subfamily C member 2 isoform X1 [Paramuricea clavata]|uniref:DnaJ homolog subfamily C member 2 n=2 Tax=Paramuricea clavata TaxID=317549 RepID=A0A6S7HLE3_PARCT|nr:dnaJ homolog subfamily C member 2 isoform X1 [Paramuricea clavata]
MLRAAEVGENSIVLRKLCAPVLQEVEPVGRWFEAYVSRSRKNVSLSNSEPDERSEENNEDKKESSSSSSDSEDERYLLTLDPKEWKDQDHYKIIGLKNRRYRATEDDIKRAYRKMVLKHHPDKSHSRKSKMHLDAVQEYFTCITKAGEILMNRGKRRAYDSIDPTFDNFVPPVNPNSKINFYQVFGPVFETNSRWSNKLPVPGLGDEDSTFEDVDEFYKFWYDFDSWREFSYLDEEEKEKGESRDERRWMEKQNRAMRQKRKKEETTRLRTLVDNCYACDPRLKKFREEEKERKVAERKAKEEAARLAAEEQEKKKQEALEAERLLREKEEQEAKEKAQAAKKEKDKLKNALKKEKKIIRTTCKEHNYFSKDEKDLVEKMELTEKLLETLSLDRLQDLKESFKQNNKDNISNLFLEEISKLKEQLVLEDEKAVKAVQERKISKETGGDTSSSSLWSEDEHELLIKAVKLFPAGTNSRWEVIAEYINHHSKGNAVKTSKHVIKKVKELQKFDTTQMEKANKNAFAKFDKTLAAPSASTPSTSNPTERYDNGTSSAATQTTPAAERSWKTEEQKLLENALRKYPSSTPERWDKIAEEVPGRTKKECMRRYKDLVEMVKAKKSVAAKSNKS